MLSLLERDDQRELTLYKNNLTHLLEAKEEKYANIEEWLRDSINYANQLLKLPEDIKSKLISWWQTLRKEKMDLWRNTIDVKEKRQIFWGNAEIIIPEEIASLISAGLIPRCLQRFRLRNLVLIPRSLLRGNSLKEIIQKIEERIKEEAAEEIRQKGKELIRSYIFKTGDILDKIQEYFKKMGDINELEDKELSLEFNKMVIEIGQAMGLAQKEIDGIRDSTLIISTTKEKKLSEAQVAFMFFIKLLYKLRNMNLSEELRKEMPAYSFLSQNEKSLLEYFYGKWGHPIQNKDISLEEMIAEISRAIEKNMTTREVASLLENIISDSLKGDTSSFMETSYSKSIILIDRTILENIEEQRRHLAAELGHAILHYFIQQQYCLGVSEAFDAFSQYWFTKKPFKQPIGEGITRVLDRLKPEEIEKNKTPAQEEALSRYLTIDHYAPYIPRKGTSKAVNNRVTQVQSDQYLIGSL